MKENKKEMFDIGSMNERIGSLRKSQTLYPLKDVEEYFFNEIKKYEFYPTYDVIANQIPHFTELNYTEYAHSFMMHPLNQELRLQQVMDGYLDNDPDNLDFVSFFKSKAINNTANKYENLNDGKEFKPKKNLVVLVGSNKLKSRVCLDKLRFINDNYGDDLYFKPHPITTHAIIGELKDLFGEEKILPRNSNVYEYLVKADNIFTTHMTETVLYSVCLDKEIEPIDAYQKVYKASFYHINKFLFFEDNPKEWINKTFNSYKTGIINPIIDPNWKDKIRLYLEYINNVRQKYDLKFIEIKKDDNK